MVHYKLGAFKEGQLEEAEGGQLEASSDGQEDPRKVAKHCCELMCSQLHYGRVQKIIIIFGVVQVTLQYQVSVCDQGF